MSLAPSVAASRTGFNPLPLIIALFCVLWSFSFVAGKIGVTDCPPLILLTARFSLAGILILGITMLRGEAWSSLTWRDAAVFAILGVANNVLFLGLAYVGLKTVSAGLGGLIVSANPVFTAALAALFLGEALTWRKVIGLVLGMSASASSSGTACRWDGQPARHSVLAGLAGRACGRHHPVQGPGAEGQPGGSAMACIILSRGFAPVPFAFTLADVCVMVLSLWLLGSLRIPDPGRIDPG